jgi:glucokinase
MARAINDLEAVACAIVNRRDCEVRPLGATGPARHGVKVVVGAGAGLGVAAMLPSGGTTWTVVASEGGHISFGPTSREEDVLFERMRDRYGRLSAAVLSGPGLELLYRAVAPDAPQINAEEIVRRAKAGDRTARACVDAFVRLLGRFAGDVVLMFKATAGVYLSGGVAVGIGEFLDAAIFRAAYEAHPPYAKLMAGIPSFLITCREPGLLGCAALAEQWFGKNQANQIAEA